jgi:site-specific DNA-methyltransferase (adenine-specific)
VKPRQQRLTNNVRTEVSRARLHSRTVLEPEVEMTDLGDSGRCGARAASSLFGAAAFGESSGVAGFHLHRLDAVEWLRTLSDGSIDLVVTDPAYESLEKHRAVGTTTRLKHSKASSNDWFQIFPNARFPELFCEIYRVLRKNSHFYLFCDQETMFVAKPLAEAIGFRFWKPLVWDKCKIGMGYHYRSRYELVLFFEKGKRKLHDLGVGDIISHPRVHRGYPAEKPPEVSEVLIRQSSEQGAIVVDPFSGSGSVGVAAVRNGRSFLGTDLCAEAVSITRRRLIEAGAEHQQALYEEARGR